MRTLKKTLCLVLAVVMLLGLCAVGVTATDFTDDASIKADYKEAVDVLSGIGVLTGKDTGEYDPSAQLTRVEGCYIICKLLGAPEGAGSTNFTDVSATDSPYVAYCQALGITNGNNHAQTTFGPYEPLTGAAFAKWLLVALGYNADIEGMTGYNWAAGVNVLVRSTRLAKDIPDYNPNEVVTREEAAALAFEALTSGMVYYAGYVESNLNTGITAGTNTHALNLLWSGTNYKGVQANDQRKFLADEYFPGLRLNTHYDNDGRPVDQWIYKTKTISEEINRTPVVTYTDKTATGVIKADLDGYTINGYYRHINGYGTGNSNAATSTDAIATLINKDSGTDFRTQPGRLVEVYADKDYVITDIVVTDTYFAKVTSKDTVNKTVTLTMYSPNITIEIKDKDYTGKQAHIYTDLYALNKNDYVLVSAANTDESAEVNNNGTILEVLGAPKIASGEISRKTTTNNVDFWTVNGTARKESYRYFAGTGGALQVGQERDLYLDLYDNIIYSTKASSSKTYAVVLDADRSGSARDGYTYYAQLLFTDGTKEWVEVSAIGGKTTASKLSDGYDAMNTFKTKSNSKACFASYEKKDDGTYDLSLYDNNLADSGTDSKTYVVVNQTVSLSKNGATAGSGKTMNNSTAILIKSGSDYKVYNGMSTLPADAISGTAAILLTEDAGTVARIIVITGDESTVRKDTVFVYNTTPVGSYKNDNDTIMTLKAIVNGEITEVDVKDNVTALYTIGKGVQNLTWGNTFTGDYVTALGTAADTNTISNTNYTANNAIKNKGLRFSNNSATGSLTVRNADGVFAIWDSNDAGVVTSCVTATGFTVYTLAKNGGDNSDGLLKEIDVTDNAAGEAVTSLLASANFVYLVGNNDGYLQYVVISDLA